MINLTIETFDSIFKNSTELLLICFSTQWCPPCKIQKQTLLELEEKNLPGVTIYSIDADEEQELSMRFGVFSIPTLIFAKKGVEVERLSGASSLNTLEEKISKHNQ